MAFRQINILHASQGCHMLFSIFPLVSAPVKHGNKVISLTYLASKIDFGYVSILLADLPIKIMILPSIISLLCFEE